MTPRPHILGCLHRHGLERTVEIKTVAAKRGKGRKKRPRNSNRSRKEGGW